MEQYIYFLFGFIFMIIMIKIIIPEPFTFRVLPNLKNYDDITYIDEEGKLYKYELLSL